MTLIYFTLFLIALCILLLILLARTGDRLHTAKMELAREKFWNKVLREKIADLEKQYDRLLTRLRKSGVKLEELVKY